MEVPKRQVNRTQEGVRLHAFAQTDYVWVTEDEKILFVWNARDETWLACVNLGAHDYLGNAINAFKALGTLEESDQSKVA